ncbi:MAG: pyrroline-5-carboxylate reductase [Clostridia bacterium]|nr:pyrroline-5-carboxylate reductase [Clostridia bacterium]
MKYGFIGCGNMGSAVAYALSKNTVDFAVTDRSGKANATAQSIGCKYTDINTIARECENIFLCVKPQMMGDMLAGISEILKEKKPVLITMAAGLTTEKICEMAGVQLPVIRIMPNTPVLLGKGIVLYCGNQLVSEEQLNDFVSDLSHAGQLDYLPETLFDAATSLTGCGPAYAYMFIDALADGAVSCGVPRKKAIEYAANVLIGAAEMVLSTEEHPAKLKDNVCSPGGSTIAGVRALEQKGFRGAVVDCIIAANEKNKELGKIN